MTVRPQPSASLIVTAPLKSKPAAAATAAYNYRVLMVQRVSRGGSFDGAHVFPGGIEEEQDHSPRLSKDAHKLCALRETFEETGLLFTTPTKGRRGLQDIFRSEQFHSICTETEARPLSPQLLARWITPRAQKRRFDTRFYMLNIADSDEFLLDQLDMGSVQTKELVQMDWLCPGDVLRANMRGEMPLFPPQFSILHQMSRYRRWQDLACSVGQSASRFDTDAIASHPVEPLLCKRSDGIVVALLPGDKAYPEYVDNECKHAVEDADLFCTDSVVPGLHRLTMRPRADGGGFDAIGLLKTAEPMAAPRL
ncbi:hypothetical protein IW140_003835 [Coemansia sp. RSA 1813]|nr:hypothetical protein EV178_001688 [Coemansia sp. RSA 1646]KAJ1765167.1 hypothetical protein LPJ74_006460 [Coemansia sp. RSA 1843]KAJ2090077.1 hypothetical protein IW138_002887 [Coemansia sp. RSA 986]KAJ2211418.1 hypothetical protein EV179_005510 [Coemansia sp. RSA 487]KAJ2568517.1 hypothetical protein IW140_003835 [Coemansia sp. RSA 1813]